MHNLYILTQDFKLEGIIDSYVSLIWTPAYYSVGDFELFMGATTEAINLLQNNRYLVRDTDISINNGVTTYRNVMIIKNVDILTDSEDGNYISVYGRELKYILNQRIVWNMTNLTGTAENAIRRLVRENAINPTDSKRIIPNLILGSTVGLTQSIDKQITGDKLDEAISDICETYNYGWDIYISNNKLVFNIYEGKDRSYNQSVNPYVIFSPDFDNLYNTEYQLNIELYANTTLIGGEGEGANRVYTTVNNNNSGLTRYEIFTDAREISSNIDGEDIPRADYIKLLQEKGLEKLARRSIVEGFSGEVLPNAAFKYGVDFNLGDVVTVKNEYGIEKDVRVLSVIEASDDNGEKLIPQFNI